MDNTYILKDGELCHYGVLGMRWGVRRNSKKGDSVQKPKTKKVSELTDAELQTKIRRMEMESRYKQLSSQSRPNMTRGRKFVADVLEQSGKNIATQAVTYAMGKGVNTFVKKAFGIDVDIVNPKKGQKDK